MAAVDNHALILSHLLDYVFKFPEMAGVHISNSNSNNNSDGKERLHDKAFQICWLSYLYMAGLRSLGSATADDYIAVFNRILALPPQQPSSSFDGFLSQVVLETAAALFRFVDNFPTLHVKVS